MKILFLDVDGVLNSYKYLEGTEVLPQAATFKYIDREKVAILSEIVNRYNCTVVLHSTWKSFFDDDMQPVNELGERLVAALDDFGIKLFGKTPIKDYDRCREIQSWLQAHADLPIDDYLIIDDARIDWQELRPHLIQTNEWYGLTREDATLAHDILG